MFRVKSAKESLHFYTEARPPSHRASADRFRQILGMELRSSRPVVTPAAADRSPSRRDERKRLYQVRRNDRPGDR